MFNFKIIAITLFAFSGLAQAQTQDLEYSTGPSSKLEYVDGPSSKLDTEELKELESYAFNANTAIDRLLKQALRSDSDVVTRKEELKAGIEALIQKSKDQRSLLLLTHSLKAGMIIVNFIEREVISAGTSQSPQGIVDQQFRILKQSLIFAQEYYTSDFVFIDGVLKKQPEKMTNPKFVEFGVKLTQFLMKMSNGITNARANYGMIRWSLGVLANYIHKDKNTGIAFASTQSELMTRLSEKNTDETPKLPDVLNNEIAPSDIECIKKTRNLKALAQDSFEEISKMQASLIKSNE